MRLVAVLAAVLALVSCTSSGGGRTPTGTRSSAGSQPASTNPVSSAPPATPTSAPTSTPATPPDVVQIFARMSEAERVGQLLMVDCPTSGITAATTTAVRRYHVGSVILDGTSQAGLVPIQALTGQLRRLAPKHRGLFIATDQEGGLVQRLQGAGFTIMPSAVEQGRLDPARLRADAATWGDELHAAGVNVNLAPVLDTVPQNFGSNPPIGDLDREYGRSPKAVAAHGVAFAQGMADAGIDATVKHFPGLGRVSGNTDTTAGVTDTVTTRHDPYLAPFAAAVRQSVPFVMMSTAIYAEIDPQNPAAFSRTIVTGMLRGDLGYRGLVISDDLGNAASVTKYSPGERAVRFVAAGGDVVLTVDAGQAAQMTGALLQKAKANGAFKHQVDTAVMRVLTAKQDRGLL